MVATMSESESRPTWDEVRIAQAIALSMRSLCTRDKVGAIITDAKHRIVGEGYNGPPPGFEHKDLPCTQWCARSASGLSRSRLSPSYADCPSSHAEANALMHSDASKRIGGTIYVTSSVCTTCAKAIASSGVARLVVFIAGGRMAHQDNAADRETNYTLLNKCGIKVDIL